MTVSVLVDQTFAVRRPVRLDVRTFARGNPSDCRVRGIIPKDGDTQAPVSGIIWFVRVKGDAGAVV